MIDLYLLLEQYTQETMEAGEQETDISGERCSKNEICETLECIWTSQKWLKESIILKVLIRILCYYFNNIVSFQISCQMCSTLKSKIRAFCLPSFLMIYSLSFILRSNPSSSSHSSPHLPSHTPSTPLIHSTQRVENSHRESTNSSSLSWGRTKSLPLALGLSMTS